MRLEVKAYIVGERLAEQLLKDAMSALGSIKKDVVNYCKTLAKIAGRMAEAGRHAWAGQALETALTAASHIRDTKARSSVLKDIATALAKAKLYDKAIQVIRSIPSAEEARSAREGVVKLMAKSGQIEKALEIVEEVADVAERSEIRAEVAEALVEAGLFMNALEEARRVEITLKRIKALAKVAAKLKEAKRGDLALEAIEEALREAKGLENPRERIRSLAAIAKAMAEIGLTDRVNQLADEALQIAKGITDEKWSALRDAAEVLASVGRKEEAYALLKEALEIASKEDNLIKHIAAHTSIAVEMAHLGHYKEALDTTTKMKALLYIEAAERARTPASIHMIAELMAHIATARMSILLLMVANDYIDDAIMAARSDKVLLEELLKMAVTLSASKRDFERALELANKIQSSSERAAALVNIVEIAAIAGRLEQALSLAKKVFDARHRAVALAAISAALLSASPRPLLATMTFTWPDQVGLNQEGKITVDVRAHWSLKGFSLDLGRWTDYVKVKKKIKLPDVRAGQEWSAEISFKPKKPGKLLLPIALKSPKELPVLLEPGDAAIEVQVK